MLMDKRNRSPAHGNGVHASSRQGAEMVGLFFADYVALSLPQLSQNRSGEKGASAFTPALFGYGYKDKRKEKVKNKIVLT